MEDETCVQGVGPLTGDLISSANLHISGVKHQAECARLPPDDVGYTRAGTVFQTFNNTNAAMCRTFCCQLAECSAWTHRQSTEACSLLSSFSNHRVASTDHTSGTKEPVCSVDYEMVFNRPNAFSFARIDNVFQRDTNLDGFTISFWIFPDPNVLVPQTILS